MGREPEEEEKEGGGWVVVETQRKTREVPARIEESRTGRIQRMYPTLIQKCNFKVDELARHEEAMGMAKLKRLEEEEVELDRQWAARTARG